MHYPYFPVPLETLAATIRYHELAEESLDLAGVRVTTRYLNHPSPAIGYRLQAGGVTLVYATDHEPHSPHHPEAAGGPRSARVHREDERHIEFLAGADLVIHDAQYTLEEYPARVTWGHTPAELAVDFAGAARVRAPGAVPPRPVADRRRARRAAGPVPGAAVGQRDGGLRRDRGT